MAASMGVAYVDKDNNKKVSYLFLFQLLFYFFDCVCSETIIYLEF